MTAPPNNAQRFETLESTAYEKTMALIANTRAYEEVSKRIKHGPPIAARDLLKQGKLLAEHKKLTASLNRTLISLIDSFMNLPSAATTDPHEAFANADAEKGSGKALSDYADRCQSEIQKSKPRIKALESLPSLTSSEAAELKRLKADSDAAWEGVQAVALTMGDVANLIYRGDNRLPDRQASPEVKVPRQLESILAKTRELLRQHRAGEPTADSTKELRGEFHDYLKASNSYCRGWLRQI